MARLVIVVNVPNYSIAELNARCQFPTKMSESLEGVKTLLDACIGGIVTAPTVQITSRDTDPAVATSGSGSAQNSFSK